MTSIDKPTLRTQILGQRPGPSLGLTLQLQTLVESLGASQIASYLPLSAEPDVSEFNSWVIASGRKLILPRIAGEALEWVLASSQEGDFEIGPLGVKQPKGATASVRNVDLVLVPALAADLSGNRLGRGKGFYDRALPNLNTACARYAVIFDSELLPEVPSEPHDARVDGAVTPSAIFDF